MSTGELNNQVNQGDQKQEESGLKSLLCSRRINGLISYEKQLRLEIDNKILQSPPGRLMQITTASFAGLSSAVYITLTYFPDGHIHIRNWFNHTDKIICYIILAMFLIKVYVS